MPFVRTDWLSTKRFQSTAVTKVLCREHLSRGEYDKDRYSFSTTHTLTSLPPCFTPLCSICSLPRRHSPSHVLSIWLASSSSRNSSCWSDPCHFMFYVSCLLVWDASNERSLDTCLTDYPRKTRTGTLEMLLWTWHSEAAAVRSAVQTWLATSCYRVGVAVLGVTVLYRLLFCKGSLDLIDLNLDITVDVCIIVL